MFPHPCLHRLISPDSRWQTTNQTAAQRQTELETCADRLGSFASAANQLGPWLREKELMMSVLGPLSIDPNMLNTQKQQVQVRGCKQDHRDEAENKAHKVIIGTENPAGGETYENNSYPLITVCAE